MNSTIHFDFIAAGKVFIACDHEDDEGFVQNLYNELNRHGVELWCVSAFFIFPPFRFQSSKGNNFKPIKYIYQNVIYNVKYCSLLSSKIDPVSFTPFS